MGVVKDETINLFNTITTKNFSKATRFNDVHGGREKLTKWKIKKQDKMIKPIEDKIITNSKSK